MDILIYVLIGIVCIVILACCGMFCLLIRQAIIDGIDFVLELFGHLPINKDCSRCKASRYIWDEHGKCIGRDTGY